jgi:hypothetical protein
MVKLQFSVSSTIGRKEKERIKKGAATAGRPYK